MISDKNGGEVKILPHGVGATVRGVESTCPNEFSINLRSSGEMVLCWAGVLAVNMNQQTPQTIPKAPEM